jgi:hypothetical protein
MNNRLIISLLIAGALAFACGPRSHSEGSTTLAAALPVRAIMRPSTSANHVRKKRDDGDVKTPAKLDAKFGVDVTPHALHFALRVTNVGSKHAELDFPTGQSHDFAVLDSAGHEVWRWAEGRMFTQGVQNKQLSAGQVLRVSETWDSIPNSGRYTAVATLNSSNYPVEQRVEFVVP